ncbi:AsmA family protein [Veronia pacifica]|uniref:AsmA domain-containing protein n=1 Tax=Veronia pacifica TaxID=1080227 RepID=A0A1C3EJP9_9GAMM|nr:AsmA family protein [Veronia pacifica]ODA33454.1 hypothetical protein A8L45_10420 [Veronia pacifica]
MAIRFVLKLIAILVITALLISGSVLAILHTQAGLPMVQLYLTWMTPFRLEAREMTYSLDRPWTLTLSQLELRNKSQPIAKADFLSATLAPKSLLTGPLKLNNLTINGTVVDKPLSLDLPPGLEIDTLAIENLVYSSPTLQLSNAKIQTTRWSVDANGHPNIHGDFQLEAPSAIWHQQTVSKLLVNSFYQNKKWIIKGLSFDLETASVSGRAVWSPDENLTINQLTISNGRLQSAKNTQALLNNTRSFARAHKVQLERLDILDLSADFSEWGVEHLNLSAYDIGFENDTVFWQTGKGTQISFNATLLRSGDYVLADAIAELAVRPDGIDISGLSARFQEGFIRLAGRATKSKLELDDALLSGVSLTFEPEEAEKIYQWWGSLDSVNIGQLTLKHLGLAVYDDSFPIFIEAVNVRGSELTLKHQGQSQMWQGDLTADAALANINRVALMTPFIKMTATDGLWQLQQATLSFRKGQGNAKGSIDLKSPSQQWQFEAQGLGIPTGIYQRWAGLNLPLSGEHDVSLSLSGLATDWKSFSFSLDGSLNAELHNSVLTVDNDSSLENSLESLFTATPQNHSGSEAKTVAVSPIKLVADRGRIKMQSVTVSSTADDTYRMRANWDLVSQKGGIRVTPAPKRVQSGN